ncbi:CRISPR-associated endonuclease Cas1 [Bacteroides sp.]
MKSLFQSFTTLHALQNAWRTVRAKNSAGGVDGFTIAHFEKRLTDNLIELQHELISGTWNPEPYLRVEITKNETEKRKLGLLCIKDKIVQQAIKTAIEPQLDKTFLNVSYGYRPGKGAERAIRRTIQELKKLKNGYIAKLDIDNYFDNINQERLFTRLGNWLKDEETLRLIKLCVQTGVVNPQLKWEKTTKGVPQGAILSPLLANFYLHPFDQFAVSKVPVYIRYADDFLIASSSEKQTQETVELIKEELADTFYLQLNKPVICNFHEGVEFLGVIVSDTHTAITAQKMKTLQERINSICFVKASLSSKSLETIRGIKNYYAKLLPQEVLKELDCALMNRLNTLIRKNCNNISGKKELAGNLQKVDFFAESSNRNKQQLIQQLCSTYVVHASRSSINNKKTVGNNNKLITQKKREYQKLENAGAELVVSTPGSYIGASYKGITVKSQGKIINKPSPALRHITVIGKGISFSSNAMMFCMDHKIPIDFFDGKGKQYATVLNPVFLDETLWSKQASLTLDRKVKLASQIIVGKLKNQLNLIKYYHKYHKDVLGGELSEVYIETVLRLEQQIEKAKAYSATDEKYASGLMGIESRGAIAYWAYIRILIADDGIDFIRREHQGATDLMNSLLNYGYAILYARVWKNILAAKLNPSIGILHAHQDGKPTLVFDIVELFRSQMVDRIVISMIQKKIPLKMHDGLLNESTKRTLIRHILERLNRYEKFRGEEMTFSQIILKQSQDIAHFIAGENDEFKPYIAKW